MAVPSAIAAAARAQRSSNNTNVLTPSRAVRRGDLRLIVPPYDTTGESRLGLVLNVDATLQFVEIALVHPYPELATSMDGVVPGALACTPYAIVVQTDLRGVVWTPVQVSRLVGKLSDESLEAISGLVETGDPESPSGIRIGTRLGGNHDRRWTFKGAEGKALDLLTSDCSGEVIDGRSPWRLDPELLVPELLASTPHLDSVLVELAQWLSTRDLRISVEDALELEERGALDFDAWSRADLGSDLYDVLIEVVEAALTSVTAGVAVEELRKAVLAPYSQREADDHIEVVHVIGTLARSSS